MYLVSFSYTSLHKFCGQLLQFCDLRNETEFYSFNFTTSKIASTSCLGYVVLIPSNPKFWLHFLHFPPSQPYKSLISITRSCSPTTSSFLMHHFFKTIHYNKLMDHHLTSMFHIYYHLHLLCFSKSLTAIFMFDYLDSIDIVNLS